MKNKEMKRLGYFFLFLLVQAPWAGVESLAFESTVTDTSTTSSSDSSSSQRDVTAPSEVTSGGGGGHGGGSHSGGGGSGMSSGGSHTGGPSSSGMSSGGSHESAPSGGTSMGGGSHESAPSGGSSMSGGSHESAPSSAAPSGGGSHVYAPSGGAPSTSGSHAESSTFHSHTEGATSSSNLSHPAGGGPSAPSTHSVFPADSHGASQASVSTHFDKKGNSVSSQHLGQVNFANQRAAQVMKSNPQIRSQVAQSNAAFTNNFHSAYHQRNQFYHDQYHHFHNTVVVVNPAYWYPWWGFGFYGAWWWGYYPCPNIGLYFYNPMVYWFYTPYWNDYYYQTWYAGDYSAYPNANRAFPYYGVWYPTENLKQLLLGTSAMSAERQAAFRVQIESFTQLLTQAVANESQSHVTLSKGDIARTHYEMLKNDDGVLLEGGVAFKGTTYHFKGLLNLNSKDKEKEHQTQVFVANVTDKPPTDDQKKEMEKLNQSIAEVRGAPEPSPSPVSSASPSSSASPADTPKGEVSADPKKTEK